MKLVVKLILNSIIYVAKNDSEQVNSIPLPNDHIQSDLNSKLDKSDPLRYRQTLEVTTTPIKYFIYISLFSAFGVLLWSFLGKIPQKKIATGVITSPFNIQSISEPFREGGIYKEVLAKVGDMIVKDQTIAILHFESLSNNIYEAEETLFNAKILYKQEYESELFDLLTKEQTNTLINSKKYLEDAKEYYAKGVIAKSVVREAESSYQAALQEQIKNRNANLTDKAKILSLEDKLNLAIKINQQSSTLKSPYSGQVLMVYKSKGQSNNTTGIFMQLDTSKPSSNNSRLEVVCYFSAQDASKIEIGQKVHILPQNIKENTVGNILGIVKSVSKLPISKSQATSILGSASLSNELVSKVDSIQVVISLEPDINNPTGYKWINGEGPSKSNSIQYPRVGLLARANVITDEIPPVTLAIPALKKVFGIQ